MKRIVIYAHNEEIEGLKHVAEKLEKQGASARFLNIKFMDPVKCDVALAPEHHLVTVKKIFEGTGIEVKSIDTNMAAEIKAENAGAVPRRGEGANNGELAEQDPDTVALSVGPAAEEAPAPLVNPGPGQDLTTLAPRPRAKK